jgi:alkanesulfonate monooxygenase SsuD/methylene tetrahydromethanopterin reductase-like flavin-dependent oxidoreductase (luciferase family)
MDFGIALTFSNPSFRVAPERLAQSQIEHAILAEELGYDHVWIAQHHGTEMYFPAPFVALGAIAARTRRIRIGTYIIILPIQHPLDVAEHAAELDVISGGRFDLGLGLGNFVLDFAAYGVAKSERAARMEEGLAIIKGLWTQENFSFEGKHYKIPPMTLVPRPVQSRPPLWVAATAEKAFDRAARYGCHLAGGSGFGLEYYEGRLRAYGHDPKEFYKCLLQQVHLAETREQAWKEAAESVVTWVKYYHHQMELSGDLKFMYSMPGGPFGVDPIPDPSDLENVKKLTFFGTPFLVGTPDDAIAAVERAQQQGFTHIALGMGELAAASPDAPALVQKSMRLYAEQVIPRFRKAKTSSGR